MLVHEFNRNLQQQQQCEGIYSWIPPKMEQPCIRSSSTLTASLLSAFLSTTKWVMDFVERNIVQWETHEYNVSLNIAHPPNTVGINVSALWVGDEFDFKRQHCWFSVLNVPCRMVRQPCISSDLLRAVWLATAFLVQLIQDASAKADVNIKKQDEANAQLSSQVNGRDSRVRTTRFTKQHITDACACARLLFNSGNSGNWKTLYRTSSAAVGSKRGGTAWVGLHYDSVFGILKLDPLHAWSYVVRWCWKHWQQDLSGQISVKIAIGFLLISNRFCEHFSQDSRCC